MSKWNFPFWFCNNRIVNHLEEKKLLLLSFSLYTKFSSHGLDVLRSLNLNYVKLNSLYIILENINSCTSNEIHLLARNFIQKQNLQNSCMDPYNLGTWPMKEWMNDKRRWLWKIHFLVFIIQKRKCVQNFSLQYIVSKLLKDIMKLDAL